MSLFRQCVLAALIVGIAAGIILRTVDAVITLHHPEWTELADAIAHDRHAPGLNFPH